MNRVGFLKMEIKGNDEHERDFCANVERVKCGNQDEFGQLWQIRLLTIQSTESVSNNELNLKSKRSN